MYHICIRVWWGHWGHRGCECRVSDLMTESGSEEVSEWEGDGVSEWECKCASECEFVRVLCVCAEVWNEYVSSALICSLEISIHSLNLTLYTNLVYSFSRYIYTSWPQVA